MHMKVIQLSRAVTTTSRLKICLRSWFKIPRYKSGLHQNIRRGRLAARSKSIWDCYMMKVAFLMVSTGDGDKQDHPEQVCWAYSVNAARVQRILQPCTVTSLCAFTCIYGICCKVCTHVTISIEDVMAQQQRENLEEHQILLMIAILPQT